MILVVLTGGIGAGKSAVTKRLAERGAVIVDADGIVRELQVPGAPLLQVLADRFGAGIINDDGSLDRAGLAAIAFKDDESTRRSTRSCTRPCGPRSAGASMPARVRPRRRAGHAAAHGDRGLAYQGMVVVDTPIELAVERGRRAAGAARGRRPGADRQADLAARSAVAMADFVVDNGGDLPQLEAQVESLWAWIESLAPAG